MFNLGEAQTHPTDLATKAEKRTNANIQERALSRLSLDPQTDRYPTATRRAL